MGDIPLQYTNQMNLGPKKKSPVALIVLIIVVLVAAGFFIARQSKKTDQKQAIVEVTKEPVPTEKPKIDKTIVKIQVQNGTGTPGQAGTAVEALKKAGYNSDNIKTANAKDFTSNISTITVKAGFEDIANDVKTSLESIFTSINVEKTKLDSSSDFDVVVVTGGKLFETSPTETITTKPTSESATLTDTPTPTKTPTPTPTP